MNGYQDQPRRRITDRAVTPGPHGYVEPEEEIRLHAIRFIGLTSLVEGVLILTRWVLLPSIRRATGAPEGWSLGGSLAVEACWIAIYALAAASLLLLRPSARWVVRMTLGVAVVSACIAVVRRAIGVDPEPGGHALATMLIVHTAGAALLPWSPRQAMTVAAVWAAVSCASLLMVEHAGMVSDSAVIFATLAVTVPGTMIAFFRSTRLHDRFTLRSLEARIASVREELSAARRIHEGAFPDPRVQGDVRFAYEYRPMSQIGGDYLFASVDDPGSPKSAVTLALLDVTGHGVPAALTVNRLQGELARLVAEYPGLSAGEMLDRLNRYVFLTMGAQSVFVTAIVMRVTPEDSRIQIANAGHPPLLIRRANGEIEQLGATATVLGAISPDEYRSKPQTIPFAEGDSIIAFTDGVTESRSPDGAMFGTGGVRSVIDAGRTDPAIRWPQLIAEAVEKHQPNPPTDDTLIVEVYRVRSGGVQ